MTQTPHEARRLRIAEIIEPWVFKALRDVSKRPESERTKYWRDVSDQATRRSEAALAKADAILADDPALVLVEALRMIAGEIPCPDNLMGNADIARAALAAYQSTGKGDAHG